MVSGAVATCNSSGCVGQAVAVWGKQWPGQTVLVCLDNMAVVAALKAGSYQDVTVMHSLHCLHFFSAYHQLRILSDHIPGKENLVLFT